MFENWISEQISLPPTLHRVVYRRAANPRVNDGFVGRLACEQKSRWHRYALTTRDVGVVANVSIERGVGVLRIAGRLRTQMSNISEFDPQNQLGVTAEGHAWNGFICFVMERVGR